MNEYPYYEPTSNGSGQLTAGQLTTGHGPGQLTGHQSATQNEMNNWNNGQRNWNHRFTQSHDSNTDDGSIIQVSKKFENCDFFVDK